VSLLAFDEPQLCRPIRQRHAQTFDVRMPGEQQSFDGRDLSMTTINWPCAVPARIRIRECGFRRRRTLIPKGTRTAFRAEGEQISERSDAGNSIVQEVFVFVKRNLSGAQRRQAAAGEERGAGKGRQSCPRLSTQRPGER